MRDNFLFLILSLFVSFQAHGQSDQFVAEKPGKTAANLAACQKKVENLVRLTAKQMGYAGKFGLNMIREPAGEDSQNRPLMKYHSGVFIVEDGYLSNSHSEVVIRAHGGACEVIKLTVSIGG